jgi:hypothetical protein
MHYVDIRFVSRDELLRIVETFPASAAALRRAQVRLALRRHIVREAKLVREAELEQKAGADKMSKKGDWRRGSAKSATFLERMSADKARKHGAAMLAAKLEESATHRGALSRANTANLSEAGGGAVEASAVEELRTEMRDGMSSLQTDVKDLRDAVAKLTEIMSGPLAARAGAEAAAPPPPSPPPAVEELLAAVPRWSVS